MTEMTTGKASVLALTAITAGFFIGYSTTSVVAQALDARIYCHANSGASGYTYHNNPAWDSHFENNGTPKSGHELDFYTIEGDTDCDGLVVTPSPTNSPTPTLVPTQIPSPTVTPTQVLSPTPTDMPSPTLTPTPVEQDPTVTPSPNPSVTPTVTQVLGTSEDVGDSDDVCTNLDGIQTSIPDGWFVNGADSSECRQFQFGGPTNNGGNTPPQGQVLGISTTSGQVLGASTLGATGDTENYLMMLGLILSGTSLYGLFTPSVFKKNPQN